MVALDDDGLSILNHYDVTSPSQVLLHELLTNNDDKSIALSFYRQLNQTPTQFTYKEIEQLSNNVAQTLIAKNLRKQIIPVVLVQSPELYISILGILKSGNIYCPILPSDTNERIEFICQETNAPLVFRDSRHSLNINPAICQEPISTQVSSATHKMPNVDILPEDLAYIMYTSGSTGTPKAVMISHSAATTSILAHDKIFVDYQRTNRFLQFANPTFDISIFEIFSAWCRGMTLVSAERTILMTMLPELIQRADINYLELTPSVAGLLPDQHDSRMASVKSLITIGEMLTKRVIVNWYGKLFNAYGPTEATLHASYAEVTLPTFDASNIGAPLESCVLVIFDPESSSILSSGRVGELCIAGPQVSKGYLQRERLNQEHFITHTSFEGLVYRTGDLAFFDAGKVYFRGRKEGDSQVKVHGQRIEIGEIEHHILEQSHVQECAVLHQNERFYAFVVLTQEQRESELDVDKLEFDLPLGIRPILIVRESIPMSSAGKRDVKQLRKSISEPRTTSKDEFHTTNAYELNSVQTRVHQVVNTVLDTSIKPMQNLREYGLDSLSAIKIVMALRDQGLSLGLHDVLRSGNMLELSNYCSNLGESLSDVSQSAHSLREGTSRQLRETYGDDREFAPCSEIQNSMIAATISDPSTRLYCNHIWLELNSGHTEREVTSAWHRLIDLHEILRTGFHMTGDNHDNNDNNDNNNSGDSATNFIQIIHPSRDFSVMNVREVVDLSSALEDHKRMVLLSVEELHKPPIDVHFYQSPSSKKLVISIMIHHALYDAWSLELILHDFCRLLEQDSEKIPVSRPTYRASLSALQRTKTKTEASRQYWERYLRNWVTSPFPSLAQRVGSTSEKSRFSRTCEFDWNWFEQKCRATDCNAQTLGQLSWSVLLSCITGESAPAMALTTSGRTFPVDDLDKTAGPFITTFPFYLRSSENASIRDAVQHINEYNLGLTKHDYSYRDILRCSNERQSPDTLFIYQKSGTTLEIGDFLTIVKQEDRLEFALLVTFEKGPVTLNMHIDVCESLVEGEAVKVLLAQLEHILVKILSDPSKPLKSLRQLPVELSSKVNVDTSSSVYGRLDSIFDKMNDTERQRPALDFYHTMDSSQTLTYGQLDKCANTLANALANVNFAPDDVIAICMDKCISMYASILAILKLGCAYVALDPRLPQDRLDVTLRITNTKHVFTDDSSAHRFGGINVVSAPALLASSDMTHFVSRPSQGLAYVLMTSGTTGIPKACAVTHSNVLSNCEALSKIYPHSYEDRMMQFTSYTFDVSVFELFFTWYNGMCLVSATKDLMLSNLTMALQKFRITHLNMTPTAAALIKSSDFPAIKCFITSGEASSKTIIEDWGSSKRYFNAYGPTETTNVCSARLVDSSQIYPSALGHLLPNSSGFVLDAGMHVLPRFSLGELWVGGAQVIRGYLDNDELTKRSFVEHSELGRIYRTGDLVRVLGDGSISIAGRADTQVKVRGFRVELSEIDHTLRAHETVLDSATISHDTGLVSFTYCSSSSNSDAIQKALYDDLRAKLPDYMIPAFIVPLDVPIPLTVSYKLDTKKLVEILSVYRDGLMQGGERSAKNTSEWSENSRFIAKLLSDISGVCINQISPDSSLFKLGLDSISAIKISASLKKHLNVEVSVSQILQLETPASIASALGSDEHEPHPVVKNEQKASDAEGQKSFEFAIQIIDAIRDDILLDMGIEEKNVESILPCTPLQEGIVLESHKGNDSNYLNVSVIKLRDGISSDKLKSACESLVHFTPSFRTRFAFTSHKSLPCVQIILKRDKVDWSTDRSDSVNETIESWSQDTNTTGLLARSPVKFLEILNADVHLLVVSIHHSVFDGWSLDLIYHDLDLFCQNEEVIPRPPITEAIRGAYDGSGESQAQRIDWQTYLTSYQPQSLPLLTTTMEDYQSTIVVDLKTPLSELSRFASTCSQSVLTLLQTSWAMCLSQITDSKDVCFASVGSGRTIAVDSIEAIATPLFNVLPIRVKFEEASTIESIMNDIHKSNLRHLSHPHYPPSKAIQAAKLEPDEVLFDTILILQRPEQNNNSCRSFVSIADNGASEYALMLEFIPRPFTNTMNLRLVANNNRISSINLELLASNLDHFLKHAFGKDNPVTDILSSFASAHRALSKPCDPAPEGFLHSAFESHAQEQPEALAIEYLDEAGAVQQLTYGELQCKASQLAGALRSQTFQNSMPVVVMMSRVPEIFYTFLGVLKAGLIYTPVAVDTPSGRLEAIFKDLKPVLILVDDSVDGTQIASHGVPIHNVASIAYTDEVSFRNTFTPEDLAYIIYTSGSTGGPKAVMLSHKAAVATIRGCESLLSLEKDSKWLQFSSLTFDMSIFDMAIAFSSGICLCGAPKARMLNDLSDVVRKLHVTHLDLTPSVAKTLKRKELPSVELLFCIGEALSRSIIVEWGSKCVNVYGPTEAAMACTSIRTSSTSVSQDIGRPFKHVQAGIFSFTNPQPLSKLACGELCIAGPQLSTGYLNDAEKTQASFFTYGNTRFYRTGDVCRMLADGSVAFLGRKDFQVKLRGQRIELGEIDQALLGLHPNIAATTTLMLRSSAGSTDQLISFIAEASKYPAAGEICQVIDNSQEEVESLEQLSKFLPGYMIPSHVITLNYIPLTPAGKIDRKSLERLWKECSVDVPKANEQMDGQFGETEERIRTIFAEMSGVKEQEISRNTSMYNLGLDSISAMQLVSILKKSAIVVSVVEILQNPSVKKLAHVIDRKTTQKRSSQNESKANVAFQHLCRSLRSQANSSCDCFPCTPVQENMIAQFLKTDGTAYYNHRLFRLEQDIDLEHLKTSWSHVIDNNALLRAGFIAMDRKDCQYALQIHASSRFESVWTIVKAGDVEVSVSSIVERQRLEILNDISRPSLHITILEAQTDRFLLFSVHHALYDGHTLDQIFTQVTRIYLNEKYIPLDNLERSLINIWSIYHDESRQSGLTAYWKDQIDKSSFSPFPSLSNSVSVAKTTKVERRVLANLQQIETECKKIGVSLFNAANAAWSKLLSAYTGEASVTFGVVLSGRTGTDLEDASCPCVTTVPYTCTLADSVRSVMQHFEQMSVEALQHQHVFLNKFSREDASPLFDSILVYQRRAQTTITKKLWHYQRDIASVEVPISLEMIADANSNQFTLELVYQEAKLPVEHSTILLAQFEGILRAILANPNADILDLEDFLSPALLSILPPKVPVLNVPVSLVHEHVQFFAQKTPHAVALEFASDLDSTSQTWTYAQVEEKSNQIANFLVQDHGLISSAPIAICVDKSPEAFLTILAVLKTGSPFCCLDSTAPIERRKFIITDSGAEAVLCSEEYRAELASAVDVKVLSIPELGKLRSSRDALSIDIKDSALCYILYTSGSTGTPKGCCLSHKSVVQALASFQTEFVGRFDVDSRFLAFASMHFDVSILETYFSWSIGARVCAAPKDALLSDIPGAIRKFGITHLDLTPQLAMTLLPDDAKTLRVFITGGEMLRKETVDHWGDSGALFNFYGPTEVTIGCTALKQVKKNARPSNIGQQWSNCGTIVASQLGRHKPALKGAVGELIVSGLQVAEGYMGLPDATNKKFKFNHTLGARAYDTGDLVRLLAVDDSFDFVGRADSQVKLRGQRIETGEIDSVLVTSGNDVRDAFTMVLKHPSQQNDHLVAFVVPRKHYDATLSNILLEEQDMAPQFEACRAKLPTYMVPTFMIPITRIDLTPTNKVDTKSLKSTFSSLESEQLPSYSQHKTRNSSASADPAIVRSIKSALADMTGINLETIHDTASVFSLGLDSVSVVGLVRKLRLDGIEVSVATVMTAEDISGLALDVSSNSKKSSNNGKKASEKVLREYRQQNLEAAAEQLSIDTTSIEDILPCTPLVEGLLVESIQRGPQTHFNAFKIHSGSIDHERLHKAFQQLIVNTKILRTRFVLLPAGLTQVIVSASSSAPRESEEFPLKSELVQLKKSIQHGEPSYVFMIHHTIYDGHSLNLILEDLNQLYAHKDPLLARTRPDFREAVAQMLTQKLDEAQNFWKQELKDSVTLTPKRKSSQIDSMSIMASSDSMTLDACARTFKCSPNTVIQAAWSIVAQQLLGGDSCFGLVVAGRNMALDDIESMVFPMFNTLPVFPKASSTQNVHELVKQLQISFGKAVQYEHTPLRDIKKLLSIRSAETLFDTLLVYQRADSQTKTTESYLRLDDNSHDSAGFSVALDVTAHMHGPIELVLNMYDIGAEASRVLRTFDSVLTGLVQGQSLSQLRELVAGLAAVPVTMRLTNLSEELDSPDTYSQGTIEETPQLRNIKQVLSEMIDTSADSISVDDTFFTMGLDSIDIVKISARLKQLYHYRLSVADIMQNCSLRALQKLLSDRSTEHEEQCTFKVPEDFGAKAAKILGIDLDSLYTILPVSPMQAGMLTSTEISEDDLYMNHVLLRIKPDVDLNLLGEAWSSVISTNDVLRTSFAKIDPDSLPLKCDYVQLIHKNVQCTTKTIEASSDRITEFYRMHKQEAVKLLRDGKVPISLRFIKTDSDSYLALSIHHVLYDGVSLDMIFQDVKTFCLTRQPVSHPSYVMLLEHIFGVQTTRSDLFWSTYLKDCAPKLIFNGDSTNGSKFVAKSKVELKKAQNVSKSLGVSLQALTQACFSKMIMEILQQPDIVFGTIQGGRAFSSEAQHIIGPCMNTVPVRASVGHETTLQSLALALHVNNVKMIEHIHTPLKKIQNLVGKGLLFETMFVYQTKEEEANQTHIWTAVEEDSSVEFPLAVECQIESNCIQWTVAMYKGYLGRIEDVSNRLDEILAEMTLHPQNMVFGHENTVLDQSSLAQDNMDHDNVESLDPRGEVNLDRICQIVAQATKINRADIHPDTSLFALGMDSIRAIELARTLKRNDLNLSVGEILRNANVTDMRRVILLNRHSELKHTRNGISARESELFEFKVSDENKQYIYETLKLTAPDFKHFIPASAAQTYFLPAWHDLSGGRFMSNFAFTLSASQSSREHVVKRYHDLIESQDILRTAFCLNKDGSELYQCVLKINSTDVTECECRAESLDTAITEYLASDDFYLPDLTRPPIHLAILRTSTGLQAAILSIHHALYDATSLPMLISHLQGLVPQQTLSYHDYAVQMHTRTRSKLAFWETYLKGVQPCWMRQVHTQEAHTSGNVTHAELAPGFSDKISMGETMNASALDRASAKIGVTSQALILSCIAKVICEIWHLEDLVLGMYSSGRSHPIDGLENVFGPTVNILPLRFDQVPSQNPVDLARRTHTTLIEMNGIVQQCSIVDIYRALNWKDASGGLVDVTVNILPRFSHDVDNNSADVHKPLTEMDRLKPHQVEMIRKRYASIHKTSVDGYQGLRSIKPAIDIEVNFEDDRVTLGLFCNRPVLGQDQVQAFMRDFWHEFENL